MAISSGLLLAASFPALSAYPLGFAALTPLLAVCRVGRARAAALGWVAGATFYAVAWRWVAPTIGRFEDISILTAVPLFALFVAYHALQLALFAVGAAAVVTGIQRHSAASGAVIASWWVVLEWSFPRIIPWSLADALVPAPLLRQMADLGGAYGLSFLVALANAWLAAALSTDRPGSRLKLVLGSGAVVAALAGYGLMSATQPDPGRMVEVAVVQGVAESDRDDIAAANENAWSTYEKLTRAVHEPIDLIVWPETTLRAYLRHDQVYSSRLRRLADSSGSPILVGGLDRPADHQGEHNAAYLFLPRIDRGAPPPIQVYRKRRLLPFGESAPTWLPWQTTGDFVPASSSDPILLSFQTRSGGATAFAASICFEAVFPGAFNDAVRSGAQFLVNITDDGWFGDTAEPHQHLNATILRAVETRRWLVRASNSGISAFVDPSGEIARSLAVNVVSTLRHPIWEREELTPYVRLGDWPVGLSLLILTVSFTSACKSRGTPTNRRSMHQFSGERP